MFIIAEKGGKQGRLSPGFTLPFVSYNGVRSNAGEGNWREGSF